MGQLRGGAELFYLATEPMTGITFDGHAAGAPTSPHCEQIEVRVAELKQLFNSIDASPFRQRDLDPNAEDFIVGWARESPRSAKFGLLVNLERAPPPAEIADESAALGDAIREFFTHRALVTRSRLRQLLRIGRISLLVGLAFLVAAVGLGNLLANVMKGPVLGMGLGPGLGDLLREGLVICGWVAMWRPLEILLYGWWPIRTEALLYDRLSVMPVRIAYTVTGEAGTKGAWRHDWPAVPPMQKVIQKTPKHAAVLQGGGAKVIGANPVPERGPIASAVVSVSHDTLAAP